MWPPFAITRYPADGGANRGGLESEPSLVAGHDAAAVTQS